MKNKSGWMRRAMPGIIGGFFILAGIGAQIRAFAAAMPFLTLDTFSGLPGSIVQVSGGNFLPGESVNVYMGSATGTPATTGTAAPDSLFGPAAATIPVGSVQGALPIIGVGATSGNVASNTFFVVPFTPAIAVATSTANVPGTALVISGTGFAPNETVALSLGSSSLQAAANASGAFSSNNLTIPSLPAGTYIIHAVGQASHATALAFFFVGGFFPTVTPSSYFILPGQTLSFSGTGFQSGETVTLTNASDTAKTALATFAAGSDGSFNNAGSFSLPLNTGAGPLAFILTGGTSRGQAMTTVTVGGFLPFASPSLYFLLPGQTLSFSGGGFAPNENVDVSASGTPTTLSTFITSASETFQNAGAIVIPFTMNGVQNFKLQGEASHASVSLNVTVGQFFPIITPSSFLVNPGAPVNFTGNGFGPNETVQISDAQGNALASFTVDAQGAFSKAGSFSIPYSMTNGALTFKGLQSGASATITLTINKFFPLITPSKFFIPARTLTFTITGTGFAPMEPVQVSVPGNAVAVAQGDASGTISAGPFTVRLSSPPTLVLTAVGELSGATASATISVSDVIPQVLGTSTLIVGMGVDNSQGGTANPAAFTIKINGSNPTPNAFNGNASGTAITLDGDTSYSFSVIAPDTHYQTSSTCPGFILMGQTQNCTLTETFVLPLVGTTTIATSTLLGNSTSTIGATSSTATSTLFASSISLSPIELPTGTVGASYSELITASTTATDTFTWSIASGTLAEGLSLDTAATGTTALLSGTPTASGRFNFAIMATDSSNSSTIDYSLNIVDAPTVVVTPAPITIFTTPAVSSGGGGGGGGGGGSGGGGGFFFDANPNPGAGLVLGASTTTFPGNPLVTLASLKIQLLGLQKAYVTAQAKEASCSFQFNRNLSPGMSSNDVKHLQQALNLNIFTKIPGTGSGSPGKESFYFGSLTKQAVTAFQNIFVNEILVPAGMKTGNGYVGPATRAILNSLCGGASTTANAVMAKSK